MMTTSDRVIWDGKSGISYDFKLYKKEDCTENIACVYIFTRYLSSDGDLESIYVGQTGQLATRIDQHDRGDDDSCKCIQRSGATHIGVYREGAETKRRDIETDIMDNDNYNWKCNQQ